MNLYKDFAKEFSQTRSNPWSGWETILSKYAQKGKKLAILDLGCGNGRFLKYLNNKNLSIVRYLGVDNSTYLLAETNNLIVKLNLKNASTMEFDLNQENLNKNIRGEFNLISAFGLMHHLESFDARKNLLIGAKNLLEPNGILVVTYWQFAKLKRYQGKLTESTLSLDKYSYNDFTLPFGTSGALRFCHFTSDDEVKELKESAGLKETESFLADGRDNNENLYKIYSL